MKWIPTPYMLRSVKFLLERGAAALWLEPGMRKSSITLATLKILKTERKGKFKTLIIAPLRVCYLVWPAEREKWDDFHGLKMEVLHGPKKEAALDRDADIYVINPDGLQWLFAALYKRDRWPFDCLVIDESTAFKRTNTQRFKNLKVHLQKFSRRYILTGTPSPNGLLDLFGQIYVLDLGNALGRYITSYRRDFFSPTGYGGYTYVLQKGAEKKIYERVRPLVLRLEAKDYIDLPPIIGLNPPAVVKVVLPPKARKIYDNMEEHLIALVNDDVVKAVNVAVATMKCRQIANGGIYREAAGGPWSLIHDEKTNALEELLEEFNGKPALVAVDFIHDIERLRKRFGKDTPLLGGSSAAELKESARIMAAFNAGDLPLVLANPQSAGHGLNLQGGKAVVFHSLTYNLETYHQFIKRIWRSGQKDTVMLYHICAKETVDQAVMAALKSKDKTQNALLAALKEYSAAKTQPKRRNTIK